MFTDNGINTVVADSYFDPLILPLVTAGGHYTSFRAPPVGLTTPAALVVGMAPGFHNPRSFQAAASVEQQVTPKISLIAGYVRNSTWDLQQLLNNNLEFADLRCQRHADLSRHPAKPQRGTVAGERVVSPFVL